MSGPRLIPPDVLHEVAFALPSHEIRLSFQDEQDAADFELWWREIGESDYVVSVARWRSEGKPGMAPAVPQRVPTCDEHGCPSCEECFSAFGAPR